MQIYGPAALHGPQSISGPHVSRGVGSTSAPQTAGSSDVLQLSDAGQLAAKLNDIPAIRADRVASIRASIANGTYETSGKLDAALNNLLDEIG